MKLKVYDISGKKIGEKNLPAQFDEDIRMDIMKRSFLALQSNKKQPYGASDEAGKRASAKLSKRRRKYRGMYGFGISRTPRKILSRRGTRMYWVGAFSPNTVGGRKAHPPKSEKKIGKKINRKERKKSIRVGISATVINDLVKKRGHMTPNEYPFILEKKFEDLSKTKEVRLSLKSFGLEKELNRLDKKKVRTGIGKLRGRKYRIKKGPLIVVSKKSNIFKSANNIPGVDIINVKDLNAELLAPGGIPGRLTLWTVNALDILEKEKLFLN